MATTGSVAGFLGEFQPSFQHMPAAVGDFASGRRWRDALLTANSLSTGAQQLCNHVVRDALAHGTDWWQLGDWLSMHPQAAYERHHRKASGGRTPAEQRPALAVLVTAGSAYEHEQLPTYGVDLDGLGPGPGLLRDPKVAAFRTARELLQHHLWLSVTLPGIYSGPPAAQLVDSAVLDQWTTVVFDESEIADLCEAQTADLAGVLR